MNHKQENEFLHPQPETWEEYQKAFEKYELEYWCSKFGVSTEMLTQAIAKVGVSAKAVEKYLKEKGEKG